ncbi:integrase arm-type DNA-binding domain-containing protein [Nitrobacter sp.]|uniref:tyrosine-type recombinase/integrase n=1 Tax=Nitrobacter sp. TaxID=29420 RepID=UPI001E0D11E0|nr:integrase arm-type DNA-binding domain-containing protein [Nitrobacter sp.]MCB1393699.1 tyrosine-type recombinase/integrase [Nitrobacter sp.]
MAQLSNRKCQTAKPGNSVVKLSDGEGLQLWIMPTGAKLWRLAYRYNGKQKLIAIGSYPIISLVSARRRRDDARKLLADGKDPSAQKKLDKAARLTTNANTFNALADDYLEKMKRNQRAQTTIGKVEWLLDHARSSLGQRPISEIEAIEVLAVLQPIEASGKLETVTRVRETIGAVFRHAIQTARAKADPTQALRGALATPKVKSYAAITDPAAFGGLLRAIDGFMGQPTTKAALQLMALLACRPGELRYATWAEFDLGNGVWSVPAPRMKMRRAHRVPLSKQAIAILRALHPVTGRGAGGLVFSGLRSVHRPISDNTMNGALRRLGYSQDEHTSHGFRSTFSTLANESGKWNADAIERQLAHVENNDVRRAYLRGDFWDERVRMMTWWAGQCDVFRQGGKVLRFKEVMQ